MSIKNYVFKGTLRQTLLFNMAEQKYGNPYTRDSLAKLSVEFATNNLLSIDWNEVNTKLNNFNIKSSKNIIIPKETIIRINDDKIINAFNILKNNAIPAALNINRITVPYCWQLLFMNLILSKEKEKKENFNNNDVDDLKYVVDIHKLSQILLYGKEEQKNIIKKHIDKIRKEIGD